jgi:predicted ATPase with chaperone activity
MTLAEAIETTRIHSVAGLTGDRTAVVTARPCYAPHHTMADVGFIGGIRCMRSGWGRPCRQAGKPLPDLGYAQVARH